MDFYYLPESSPARSIIMLAEILGLKLNKKLVNLKAGEQLKPEFLKINPQHTVPTLVDNGFSLWESRAILVYLAEKYGKDDSLYPKCPQKRAVVNQRLYFDMNLYATFGAYYYPIHRFKQPEQPELLKKLDDQLEFLNTFLEGQKYAAGDALTLADLALLSTVSTFDASNIDLKKFPNVWRWYEHCKKTVKGFDENWDGCEKWKTYFK